MKECPRCFRCWDDSVEICADDDARLRAAFAGPAVLDGKYRVDQRLGRGGMGVVYRVHHLGLQKTFALKVIATVDEAFLGRFRAEAEALGKLHHPNIVDVTDFGIDGREGGLPYLVMEYLEGSTLADHYRRFGRLPPERALPIFESIATAIDHAHERGILHLDLKPGNVFVSSSAEGREAVKILDFGLARFISDSPTGDYHVPGHDTEVPQRTSEPLDVVDVAEAQRGDAATGLLDHAVQEAAEEGRCPQCGAPQASATPEGQCPACVLRLGLSTESWSGPLEDERRSGLDRVGEPRCVGTVAYMAPEVFSGTTTRASDIYSFGILIYEVLVGRRPFQGSDAEIIAGHRSGAPPPLSHLNAALPGELDHAVLPALATIPDHRPARAADLVRQIRSAVFRARLRTWRRQEIPRRIALAAIAAVVIPLMLGPVWRWGALQQIENRLVDARFLSVARRAPDPRLILLSLDEPSLAADPTPLTGKADEFGRELQRVFDAGARGVAIDFLLPETWSRSSAFSKLILRHPDALTLAAFSSPGGDVIGPECLNALTAAALGARRASDLFAFVNVDEDADGVNRRMRLSYLDRSGRQRDAWARRAVRSLERSSAPVERDARQFWIDHSVDWRRFKRLSWKDLATTLTRDPDVFRDRLVLVGGDFIGFGGDYHRISSRADRSEGVSGLVLQALMANTILSRFPVREVAPSTYLVGVGLTTFALMVTTMVTGRWLVTVLLLVTLVTMAVGASFPLFGRTHVLVPLVGPLLTAAVAILVALGLRLVLPAVPGLRTDGS
jgi:serine/threonine protein kinase